MRPAISMLLAFVLTSSLSCSRTRPAGVACEEGVLGQTHATGPQRGAELLRSIKKGMTEDDVTMILGPPQTIWVHGIGLRVYMYTSHSVIVWFDEEGRVEGSEHWSSTTTSVPSSQSEILEEGGK